MIANIKVSVARLVHLPIAVAVMHRNARDIRLLNALEHHYISARIHQLAREQLRLIGRLIGSQQRREHRKIEHGKHRDDREQYDGELFSFLCHNRFLLT